MSVPKRNAEPAPIDRVLVITRLFDAPRELVFQVFTDPRHAVHWMGPRHHPMTQMENDRRPGGKWRACLKSVEDGTEIWQCGINHEILPPERLSFTFAWEEVGALGPETLVTITFAAQGNKTLMTFRQEVFDTVENRDGHQGGWNSTFDRLEDYLATL
jgi:uncharacterized protein YndB with AHSA1/START domain